MSQVVSLCLDPVNPDWINPRKWRNDPRIYKWCRQNEPISIAHHLEYLERSAKDPHSRMYGVAADGFLVGVCGLTSIDWINRRAEVSLYIDPEKHRQGLGTMAAKALMAKAFMVHNLNSIWGEAFDGSPAIGLFEKLGFKQDGLRREFYFREGKYVDAVIFSKLRCEYA